MLSCLLRMIVVLQLIVATTFAADGFWSRGISDSESVHYQDTLEEQPEGEYEPSLAAEHRKYKSGVNHILGLFEETLPDLPNDISQLDGVMDEVAGLLFHSTPLSSPISEDPEFFELATLQPAKLDKQTAYGFREATKDDEEILGIMALLAGYYGAYLADKTEHITAQLLIDKLHLEECNTDLVGDYEAYLGHVAHMLRFVETGLGKKLHWYGTLYGSIPVDQDLLTEYMPAAEAGAAAYGIAIKTAEKYECMREYNEVLGNLGLRVNAHNKDAPIKSATPDGFEHLSVLSNSYSALMQSMSELKIIFEIDMANQPSCEKFQQFDDSDKLKLDCKELLEAMLDSVDGFYRLEQRAKKDLGDSQWKDEKELLERAQRSLKKIDIFGYGGKVANKIINLILSDSTLKDYITRDDVLANIRYLIVRYGSLDAGLKTIPNFTELLRKQYNAIVKAVLTPPVAWTSSMENVACVITTNYSCPNVFHCIFHTPHTVFILPEFLYKTDAKWLYLHNVWPPRPKTPGTTAKTWTEMNITGAGVLGKNPMDISKLPDCWERFPNLEVLMLGNMSGLSDDSGFVCDKLPASFSSLTKLTRLGISNMNIIEVPDCFRHMSQLSSLFIEGNPFADKISSEECRKMHLKAGI